MTEQDLRALIRETVLKALAAREGAGALQAAPLRPHQTGASARAETNHPSHGVFLLVNTGEACLIEPSVTCTHCEYCRSHGH